MSGLVTDYQLDKIAAWLGNLGWIAALTAWSIAFVWKGFRK